LGDFRKYGKAPFRILVIHGGPGGPGSVAPLAESLSANFGIVEPFQTEDSIAGQIKELDAAIDEHAEIPVILIGHSWGVWLSCLYAADFPEKMKKLVMIGSGPFEEKYVPQITETRNKRFTPAVREELSKLEEFMKLSTVLGHELIMKRYAELMHWADSFDPLPVNKTNIMFQPDIYRSVWTEASALRKSGKLLEMAGKITCPVAIFHGYDDPHPAAGVTEPLTGLIKDMKFVGLENCGHEPWNEKHAREGFLNMLIEELND